MVARGEGTIINVSGMIAFSGPATSSSCRAAPSTPERSPTLVAMDPELHAELESEGIKVQVLCPGVVATEFHDRQGMDLSAFPRMSAEDVVTASLRGFELGEVVCAPGSKTLTPAGCLAADLAAFGAKAPTSHAATGRAEKQRRSAESPMNIAPIVPISRFRP